MGSMKDQRHCIADANHMLLTGPLPHQKQGPLIVQKELPRGPAEARIGRILQWAAGALAILALIAATQAHDDSLDQIKDAAKPATQPSGELAPDTQPGNDPLGTKHAKSPLEARIGTVTLSNDKKYEGRIWTTLATPLRIWLEAEKRYNDIDWALIKTIDVDVEYARMEDDWRWLKEGSDKKILSGKKYPNVSLRYKFTLLNDQQIEGTVVAPIYVNDGKKIHNYALYKKYKGKLDETLADLIYIKNITLHGDAQIVADKKLTTKLPLITD